MISSIGSSMMTQMGEMMGGMQRPQNSDQMFKRVDSSGDGSIDSVELSSLATQLGEQTGIEIDTENAVADYDSDGDGGLNGEELKTLLGDNGITQPDPGQKHGKGGMGKMMGGMGQRPEGAGSSSAAIQAYLQQLTADTSEDNDLISQFMEQFNTKENDEQAYSQFSMLI